jgi:hypothetical protein
MERHTYEIQEIWAFGSVFIMGRVNRTLRNTHMYTTSLTLLKK